MAELNTMSAGLLTWEQPGKKSWRQPQSRWQWEVAWQNGLQGLFSKSWVISNKPKKKQQFELTGRN